MIITEMDKVKDKKYIEFIKKNLPDCNVHQHLNDSSKVVIFIEYTNIFDFNELIKRFVDLREVVIKNIKDSTIVECALELDCLFKTNKKYKEELENVTELNELQKLIVEREKYYV